MRWTLITALAKSGRFGDAEIDAELEVDKTISGQEQAAAARAAQPTPEAKEAAWAAIIDPSTPNETAREVAFSIFRFGQEDVLEPYLEKFLTAAETLVDVLGLPQGVDDPRVRLPEAARLGRDARPARRVARREQRAQAGQALHRRGSRRHRPRAHRPGVRRPLTRARCTPEVRRAACSAAARARPASRSPAAARRAGRRRRARTTSRARPARPRRRSGDGVRPHP